MKTLRNALFQVHWIVGITAGCVLALVGLTGAMLSFEEKIVSVLNEDARTVMPRSTAPLSVPQLLKRIELQHPDARVASLLVFGSPSQAWRVTFEPASARAVDGQARGASRYVNPYTGSLSLEPGDRGESFFRSVRSLHRWLMLGEWGNRDVGRQITGACALLLVLMCATGLYLRWPRNGHTFHSWLVPDFALRGRSFLWNLHATVGTWLLLFYLVIALTGLQWSYEWYRNGLYALAGVERSERPERSRALELAGRAPDLSRAWRVFLEETETSGFNRAILRIPRGGPDSPVEIRYLEANPAHSRAYNTLAVEPVTGVVVKHERYAEKNAGGKLIASVFALHSGQFFGTPGMLAFMLASLGMPLFAVTGWMLYLDRRKRKARSRARMAALTPVT